MLELRIFGTPAPQGSKRGFLNKFSGRIQMVESSKKVKPWRQDVKEAAEKLLACGEPRLSGPIRAQMVFTVRKPASAPKKRRIYPSVKPDLSKLIRSTEDALTDAGLIRDDALIVEYSRAAKVYPLEDDLALPSPGVYISLTEIS